MLKKLSIFTLIIMMAFVLTSCSDDDDSSSSSDYTPVLTSIQINAGSDTVTLNPGDTSDNFTVVGLDQKGEHISISGSDITWSLTDEDGNETDLATLSDTTGQTVTVTVGDKEGDVILTASVNDELTASTTINIAAPQFVEVFTDNFDNGDVTSDWTTATTYAIIEDSDRDGNVISIAPAPTEADLETSIPDGIDNGQLGYKVDSAMASGQIDFYAKVGAYRLKFDMRDSSGNRFFRIYLHGSQVDAAVDSDLTVNGETVPEGETTTVELTNKTSVWNHYVYQWKNGTFSIYQNNEEVLTIDISALENPSSFIFYSNKYAQVYMDDVIFSTLEN